MTRNGDCQIETCARPHHARGLCRTHYSASRRGAGTREAERRKARETPSCRHSGCARVPVAEGRCRVHHWRVVNGKPVDGRDPNVPLLSHDKLIELRRAVGLADTGPTREQALRWTREENEQGLPT